MKNVNNQTMQKLQEWTEIFRLLHIYSLTPVNIEIHLGASGFGSFIKA